jgi:hypothetical protein
MWRAMAGLKNLTRVETSKLGRTTWILLDEDGTPLEAFSFFCERNRDYAFATQKRYAEVVAAFLDYLVEAQVFGVSVAPTKRHVNAVIEAYPLLLRDGSAGLLARLNQTITEHPEDQWLVDVCQSQERKSLMPGSFSNTLAGINRFLRLSESLAVEAFERAALHGVTHENSYATLFATLSGVTQLSPAEKKNLRANSVLGSVMRFRGEGLTRPRQLSVSNDVPHTTS